MKDQALKVIEMYAEGGTLQAARDHYNMRGAEFYRALSAFPEVNALYVEAQKNRADMMYDEAYQISTDATVHPSQARVQAEIRMKIAAAFDRAKFGDNLKLEVDQTVSVSDALTAARNRALRPRRDLENVIDVQPSDNAQQIEQGTTDKQSVALPKPKVNPFE